MPSFENKIETREQLREIINEPFEFVSAKTLDHIDVHCRTFLNKSRFLLLATADQNGRFDVSPKGDPEGFVQVIDDRTLAIPDRLGNNRVDTLENIIQNPNIGMICIVPGEKMTLRISGTATIVQDSWLLDSMKVRDKAPNLAVVVAVQEAFFHCSKCMIRSNMWNPEQWPDRTDLPTLAQTMIDAGKANMSYDDGNALVASDEETRLY